jgi:hypothetical protein
LRQFDLLEARDVARTPLQAGHRKGGRQIPTQAGATG